MKTKIAVVASVLAVAAVWAAGSYRNTPHRPADLRDAVSDTSDGALDSLKSAGGGLKLKDAVPVPAEPAPAESASGENESANTPLVDLNPGDGIRLSRKLSRRLARVPEGGAGMIMYVNGKEVKGLFSAFNAAAQVTGNSNLYATVYIDRSTLTGSKCKPLDPDNSNFLPIAAVRLVKDNTQKHAVIIEIAGESCVKTVALKQLRDTPQLLHPGATVADLEGVFGGKETLQVHRAQVP